MIARLTVCAALAVLSLAVVSGCASPSDAATTAVASSTATSTPRATDATGTVPLAGAGTSWQGDRIDTWTAAFTDTTPQITYSTSTTASARALFSSGRIDFLGADRAFMTTEIEGSTFAGCASGSGLTEIPVSIGAISVVYNLPGVDELKLDAGTLAGIFTGDITEWDDPAIVAQNPDADLPHRTITPVHLSGASGITSNFTDYLSAGAEAVWTYGSVDRWPDLDSRTTTTTDKATSTATATDDAATAVAETWGSIGYVDTVTDEGLSSALLRVGDAYVAASAASAANAVTAITTQTEQTTRVSVEIDRTPAKGVYPLAVVNYLIGCAAYTDPVVTDEVRTLFGSAVSADAQAQVADTGLAPVTASLRARAIAALALMGATD